MAIPLAIGLFFGAFSYLISSGAIHPGYMAVPALCFALIMFAFIATDER